MFWARVGAAACCLICLMTLQSLFFAPLKWSLYEPLRVIPQNLGSLLRPGEYKRQMIKMQQEQLRGVELPKLCNMIGTSSVDVFGQDQSYAIFNRLNYKPRPVFQSYLAYNVPLMRLNEQFYLSPAAPDYVLFALAPIDHKFPPLEDALTLRCLLINYEPVEAEGPFLLLKAHPKLSIRPNLTLLREGTVQLGGVIDLKDWSNDNIWMEIQVEPTLIGRARQFFYKGSKLRLAVWKGGQPAKPLRYPAPAPMLAAGFLASPLLLNRENVMDLYRGKGTTRPTGYSVEAMPGENGFWSSSVRFRVYRIANKLDRSPN